MEIKQIFQDEDAVSPVIGVILMVAITVILAAVIGTFVLGLGDQVQDNAPQVSFSFDYSSGATAAELTGSGASGADGDLTVTHDGGDSVLNSQLSINDQAGDGPVSGAFSTTEVTAGSSATISIDSDDVVRVIWTSDGGGNTATLGQFSGPDA